MKPGWGRIDVARIGETVASLKDALVTPTSRALVELQNMLTGGLTFTDNFKCALIKRDLVHGAEQPVTLGFKPIGVYALRSEAVRDGARYGISSLDWRLDAPGGTIGVTALYSRPNGDVTVLNATGQSINNAAATAVQWSSATTVGSALSWSAGSNTRITANIAGRMHFTFSATFNVAAAGFRELYINVNGAVRRYGDVVVPGGTAAGGSGSDYITVAIGDYLELISFQNSGAALGLLAPQPELSLTARFVDPPSTATNTVTLLCVGG